MANKLNGTRRPADGVARERLRAAQLREAHALEAVTRADRRVRDAKDRLAQLIAKAESSVAEARRGRGRAIGELVQVSGIDRTALLLSESVAEVRRAVRMAATVADDAGSAVRPDGRDAASIPDHVRNRPERSS